MKKTLAAFALCIFTALSSFSQSKDQPSDTLMTANEIYTKPEIEAEFPMGRAAWTTYFDKNMKYPPDALKKNIGGEVVVQFIVDKEGLLSNVMAISGPVELRPEAERVVKKSRRWVPAVQGGKIVKSSKKLLVTFYLPAE